MSLVNEDREKEVDYESLTQAVLDAVGTREGTTPAELDPSLYEVLDPDALNSLFAPTAGGATRSEGRVMFTYYGYDITVFSDGCVRVHDSTDAAVSTDTSTKSLNQ